MKNLLIGPAMIGNPITAWEIDDRNGFAVVGTASGGVFAWKMPDSVRLEGSASPTEVKTDDIEITVVPVDDSSPPSPNKTEVKSDDIEITVVPVDNSSPSSSNKFFCRQLCRFAEEAIRGVFIDHKHNRISVVIGDQYVRAWSGYMAKRPDSMRIYRSRHYGMEQHTFTMCSQEKVLVLQAASNSAHMLDLVKRFQDQIDWAMPANTVPLFFDGEFVVWMTTRANGSKDVQIHEYETRQLRFSKHFPRANKFYWGFAVSGSRFCYVSNHKYIKVHDWGQDERVHKLDNVGEVACFTFSGNELISLGTDKKVRVWDVESGKCTRTVKVLGKLDMRNPYSIRKIGDRIWYVCDEGLFVLEL